MRLIGRSNLLALAQGACPELQGTVLALDAELLAAEWFSVVEAKAAFPMAKHVGNRIIIALDYWHCTVVAINYERGIAVIEFVGQIADYAPASKQKGGSVI